MIEFEIQFLNLKLVLKFMDFLFDEDDTALSIESFIKSNIITMSINQCCGHDMRTVNAGGMLRYECDCGKFINTNEVFNGKVDTTMEFDKPQPIYGMLSGSMYVRKMKEELRTNVQKINPFYKLTDVELSDIIDLYFTMRGAGIQRAAPRQGMICAVIHRITKLPVDYLSKIFDLEQKYITDGEKTVSRQLTPFHNMTVEDLVEQEYKRMACQLQGAPLVLVELIRVKALVIDIVKLSIGFHIAMDTNVKTKIAGILLYLCDVRFMNLEGNDAVAVLLSIGKNTIYKFYDQFVIMLHVMGRTDGRYVENFTNCRTELRAYLAEHGIPVVTLPDKKRLLKYRTELIF